MRCMNPFTAHPKRQGISYIEHWCFAVGIACRLFGSVVAFVLHATLPFIPISPRLDLESTAAFLTKNNQWIESVKTTHHTETPSSVNGLRTVRRILAF